MLGFIFRLLLAIIAFQIIGGLIRALRGNRKGSKRRHQTRGPRMDTGEKTVDPRYEDLTPYEIEDAEFEDLPKRED